MTNPTRRIIVKFKSSPELDSRALSELCDKIAGITHGFLVRPPRPIGRAVFQLDASSDLGRLIREIQQLPSVEYAEPDVIDRSSQSGDTP